MQLPFWALVLTVAVMASEQPPPSQPDFTGTWKLNVQRSGPILPRGLTGLVIVIDHAERSTLRVVRERVSGTPGPTSVFGNDPPGRIDGREHVTHPAPGKTVRRTDRWAGATLVTHQVITSGEPNTFPEQK